MAKLTTRSKVAVRYTTNPANMGYGGIQTDWTNAKPDVITSPAKALDYLRELSSKMGGSYYAVDLKVKGEKVSVDDVTEVVMAAEFKRLN